MPVRATSRMPKGRIISSKVFTRSEVSESSMVMEVGDVRHFGAADAADGHDLLPGALVGADLDEHQLPSDEGALVQGTDLDDLDKLVELLFHLLHHAVSVVYNDGDAGERGVVGDAHRQGVDIEGPAGKQAGDAVQNPRPVLHQHGNGLFHMRSPPL